MLECLPGMTFRQRDRLNLMVRDSQPAFRVDVFPVVPSFPSFSGEGDAPVDAPEAHVGAVLPEADLHRLRQSHLPVAGECLAPQTYLEGGGLTRCQTRHVLYTHSTEGVKCTRRSRPFRLQIGQ